MKNSLISLLFGLLLAGSASAQWANDLKIALPNGTERKLGAILADVYTVKSFGAVCNNSNNDTQAIQYAANNAPYGATIRIIGQCKVQGEIVVPVGRTLEGPGQEIDFGGFLVDTNYRGVVVRVMTGASVKNLAIHSIDVTHTLSSDSTQIGILVPENSLGVVLENVKVYGLGVGQKIGGQYHSLKNLKSHICGIGQWVRGRENPNFIYTGAFTQTGGHFKGNQRAGVYVQGFTNTVTYSRVNFEQNRYHARVLEGTVNLSGYLGDDPKHSVLAEGAARVIVENRLVDPLHGGGATYWLGGQSTRSNYEGGSIYATGTSQVIVKDGDLNNSIGFGNIGFTDGGLGLDQDRGQAIYIGPNASVRVEGQTKSNVIFPVRGAGKLTADVAIPNYITGGSLDDPKRLPHAINAPITIDSTLRVPGCGYAVTITQPGGFFYEVPARMVGKTMYLVVANFGVSSGGSFAVLKPGVNTGFGRDSKGWTLVARGNPAYPWQSIAGEQADRISILPAKYSDQAVIDRIPVRIDSARGSFALYPSASVKLGGAWLMEAENLERIPIFKDVQTEYLASATPTRGTWSRGDAVRTYNTVTDGFTERICTVAGTPGTWLALPVGGGGGGLTTGQVTTIAANIARDSLAAAHLYLDEASFSGSGTPGDPYKAIPARGFTPKGAWAAATLYLIDDIVTRTGQTYRVTANHTSPGSFTTTNLELWAASGANGADGAGLNSDYALFSGLIFETESIALSTSNVTLTSGSTYTRRIVAPKTGSVTSLAFRVSTAGATLTAGANNNGIAILDASGNRLGIADCNTAYTTVGDKSVALDATVSMVAGTVYYIAVVTTGTTPAVLGGVGGTNFINLNQTVAPWNHGRQPTGGIGTSVVLTTGNLDARSSARVFVGGF